MKGQKGQLEWRQKEKRRKKGKRKKGEEGPGKNFSYINIHKQI